MNDAPGADRRPTLWGPPPPVADDVVPNQARRIPALPDPVPSAPGPAPQSAPHRVEHSGHAERAGHGGIERIELGDHTGRSGRAGRVVAAGGVGIAVLAVVTAVMSSGGEGADTVGGAPTYSAPWPPFSTASATPGYRSTTRSTSAPRTPSQPPLALRVVTAPGGLTVSIPADWPVAPGAVPSNLQADEPGGTGVYVRFGGSPAGPDSLFGTIAAYDRDFAVNREGYQRIRLETASSQGGEAVDWEFLFTKDGVARHASGHYWRSGQTEYVVYAAAPVDRWPQARDVLQVMIQTASPTSVQAGHP